MKKNQKKYRFMLLIISIILIGFQNGYSEWVKEDFFNKLNLDLGEIYQFKINSANEIVVLNKANEIITINFETGEISNRCKCEIDSAASFIAMSSDGNSVVMQYYDNNIKNLGFEDDFIFKNYFNIYNNKCENVKRIDKNLVLKPKEYELEYYDKKYEAKFIDYDFNSEKILFHIKFYIQIGNFSSESIHKTLNFTQLYDTKNQINMFEENLELKSSLYNLNNFENLFLSLNEYNYNYHQNARDYSLGNSNYLKYFNQDSNKLKTLLKVNYRESKLRDDIDITGYYFIPMKIFNHYNQNNLYLFADRYLSGYENILFSYEFNLEKNILETSQQIIVENNSLLMDNNFNFHQTIQNKYYLFSLKPSFYIMDSLVFPMKISEPKLIEKNIITSLIVYSENKLYSFSTEKLNRNLPFGFTSDKQLVYLDSIVQFSSNTNINGFKYEWEFEPNTKINTLEHNINYQFKNAGTYDIKLKVTDNDNKDYYFIKENYITVLPNLKAEFTYKEDNDYAGTFHFENTSVGKPNNNFWYINDSLISNEKNLTYKFHLFGDYKIKLIVEDVLIKDTIEKVVNYRKNQKIDILDSTKIIKFISISKGGLFSSEKINYNLKLFSKDAKIAQDYLNVLGIKVYQIYIIYQNFDILSNKLTEKEIKFNDTINIEKLNLKKLHIFNHIVVNDSIVASNYNYFNNTSLIFKNTYEINYTYKDNKFMIDRSHKVDDNNINTFTLEQPDSILMRDITINPKTIKPQYLTFDKNIINFETEFKDNTNYLLIKYQDSTFSLNQYKFFAKNISDVINLPKSFDLSKLSIKGDNLYILGSEPLADIRRGVIYKYNLSSNSLEKYESDTYSNFTKIKWLTDKSFVAWGSQSGSKGFVFLRNNLEVIKTNVYKNITGEINNIFLDDKKLTIVYENKEGVNYNVYVGEDEFTDDFIETLSNNVEKNEVIIYPNPTSNKIKILQQEKAFSISIFNITGLEIYSNQDIDSDTEIDLSQLPIGNYWLKINNSDKMYSLQINR